MWEKHLGRNFLIVLGVLLVAGFFLYPPSQQLRGGQDIEGGVALIFEIEREPGEIDPTLAERMKNLLAQRVDPSNVYDLTWRVLGDNRIEVQMPLPPPENQEYRRAFVEAREVLYSQVITRSDIEAALRLSGAERTARINELSGGNDDLRQTLTEAARYYDEYSEELERYEAAQAVVATQPAATQPEQRREALREERIALRDAQELFDDAVMQVLDAKFPIARFEDMLAMDRNSERREASLRDLEERFPTLAEQMETVVAAHDAWKSRKQALEGPADLIRLVQGAGVLEFRILAETAGGNLATYNTYREQLRNEGPRPQTGDRFEWFRIDNPLSFFNLPDAQALAEFNPAQATTYVVEQYQDDWYVLAKRGPENTLLHQRNGGPNWSLRRAAPTRDSAGRPAVAFGLDPIGGSYFGRLTRDNIGKQLAIFLDEVVISSATINSRITTDGIITGDFSREKVNYLVSTMEAGSLPSKLKDTPLSERTIGSTLGHTNLQYALNAGIAGVIAVGILMIIYYMWAGAIANVALILNILLVLAAMSMLEARFTLAGIAGVILTIGMTVDANVLIFERMREEKDRGSSLRMIVKNGYDKAFSTIIDANITTLLTCVIIFYAGSEQIRGFGLTLGWGIVTSLFTALFVTRTIFTALIKYHVIRDIKMMSLVGVPTIDWYSKRKIFLPISVSIIIVGMSLLFMRGANTLDVEFRGGVNAEVGLRAQAVGEYNDAVIRERLEEVGGRLAEAGAQLQEAQVAAVPGQVATYRVEVPGVDAQLVATVIAEPLEGHAEGRIVANDGIALAPGGEAVLLTVRRDDITAEKLQNIIRGFGGADGVPADARAVASARIAIVLDTLNPEDEGRYWDVTTTATNKELVQQALLEAFGEDLQIEPEVSYVFRGLNNDPYPITSKRLEVAVPGLPAEAQADVTDYLDGAAIHFTQLDPPQSTSAIERRLQTMRLQPDYQNLPYRRFAVFGVNPVGTNPEGDTTYSQVVIAVSDPAIDYETDRAAWEEFAGEELALAQATLEREQTLRKLTQFKPSIAAQAQQRALIALVLSWGMIILYLWIRFGKPIYGIAGVVALIHDVLIALAFVGISGWLGGKDHPIGAFFLIDDFRINMTIVAAFLTIIGYSINDTIVVFDRIRETRGRLGIVTPDVINRSINQCLSRTVLTSVTTLVVLLTMYIFGGSSIRGFNYCMIIGVLTGTYSSIAVASPLLMASFAKVQSQPRTAPAPA